MSPKTTKNAVEPDSLIKAIAEKLAAQDNASRLQRATVMASTLFSETVATVASMQKPQDSVIQEDLGQDPGDKAVGYFGAFWDNDPKDPVLGILRACDSTEHPYCDTTDTGWRHFRHVPTTPEVLQWLKDNNV